ncbi:hypothetical protein Pfo_013914 [Paulownia fortunei]|nr:hypothetical protein Pfo_013914 [Paulownia fortunei]
MDTEFRFQIQSPPLCGGEAASVIDEAYINGVYAGLNFRSLLTYDSFVPAAEARNLLSMPKAEHLFTMNDAISAQAPPFDFFSEAETSSSNHIQNLPNLLSLELPHYTAARVESNFPLNHRVENVRTQQQRRRRRLLQQRVIEKTRCLQKLLPWDKKMDMATVLEEAYKYIKFLQAQVSVLQSMPNCESGGNGTIKESGEDLWRLNRQQLLQVLVNSPMAQTLLYSKGCCVYSMEQLVLLKKNAERKALFHQMLHVAEDLLILDGK